MRWSCIITSHILNSINSLLRTENSFKSNLGLLPKWLLNKYAMIQVKWNKKIPSRQIKNIAALFKRCSLPLFLSLPKNGAVQSPISTYVQNDLESILLLIALMQKFGVSPVCLELLWSSKWLLFLTHLPTNWMLQLSLRRSFVLLIQSAWKWFSHFSPFSVLSSLCQ